MESLNTIQGYHVKKNGDGSYRIGKKEYCWHIPKHIRGQISKGDFVLANVLLGEAKRRKVVLVTDVFREDLEVTKKHYRSVARKIDFHGFK